MRIYIMLFLGFVSLTALSAFQVKSVAAQQRYPWNGKVDIDFVLESDDADEEYKITVECIDLAGNTNIVLRTLRNNDKGAVADYIAVKRGSHRVTWDADADAPNQKYPNLTFVVFAHEPQVVDTSEYLIIDLSGGPNATSYPVATMTGVPSGGWGDEHKKTKLVMRRCPKGADPLGRYTLTQDFYIGVFEVTQKQWEMVMGTKPSFFKGDTIPVESVSYDMIRGGRKGTWWPDSPEVDSSSFIWKLRARTGLDMLDLPTEAQWEYACRAGTATEYNTGDGETELTVAGWYKKNSDGVTHPVGEKTANAWGLYDMHGNVWEWCLDWYLESLSGADPVGAASGFYRRLRGGSWIIDAGYCTSSYRRSDNPSSGSYDLGFRLARTVP